jgi:hypothetical protein
MMRFTIALFPLISILFFPVGVSIVAVLVAAFVSPLIPLGAGILAEVLYGAPHAASAPWYLMWGILGSLIAFGMHRFVETSIIKG